VKIRVRQRREMYQTLIDKISIEINSLDSLKEGCFKASLFIQKALRCYWLIPQIFTPK